jgi:hypothetical protein
MNATVFTACLRGVTILRTYFLRFLSHLSSPHSNKRGIIYKVNALWSLSCLHSRFRVAPSDSRHPYWEPGVTWKSALNNLRLIIQPYIFWCSILPWLKVFPVPGMKRGFFKLIEIMNGFRASPVEYFVAS